MGSKGEDGLWGDALSLFVGGAQGGLRREFHSIDPLIVSQAKGSRIRDYMGREYIDFHMAFGAIALGHNDDYVVTRVREQLDRLILHGAGVSDVEIAFAKKLIGRFPMYDKVLFTNSGSEAVMIAIRLARAYTGRDLIVKFDGNYHGWHDYSMYNVKTPAYKGKTAESKGIPDAVASTVEVLPYNDLEAVERFMEKFGDRVAAFILEPVAHSMGVIPAERDFVAKLRRLCDSHGSLLIFDEIITFIRVSDRGMQDYFGVKADLTTVGKAIANGMPVAALLGGGEVMELLGRGVVSSGTYSGHPLSMAAGVATLEKAERVGLTRVLNRKAKDLAGILRDLAEDLGVEAVVSQFGGSVSIYFGLDSRPKNLEEALRANGKAYRAFASELRRLGILVTPNPLKRMHLAYSHGGDEFEAFHRAAEKALRTAREYL
ncbi:aspartate aminotransferase family protein [Aeropyrum camini]|uniref:Glutamate-1-semialdehyde aminotransferase n=1 Tax=Aeropyrum camini SY1 = JCM 12091 TaxID=1198449 RepID=U3TFN8_9CREN|nr:aspartate aminotransferase family protein [Aeropyrum camini]BAN90803.1 glutamate-1-semialdehyde aminotransferase [Aeropyrum camini SY1 = JCM 12091]